MLRSESMVSLLLAAPSLGLPGEEAPKALEEHVRKIAEAMVGAVCGCVGVCGCCVFHSDCVLSFCLFVWQTVVLA